MVRQVAFKKWILNILILGLVISSGVKLKAEPEIPSQLPNSANWINQIFSAGSSLVDVSNPMNWVVYSAAGTYFYYQYIQFQDYC